jgi:hypothetical protein
MGLLRRVRAALAMLAIAITFGAMSGAASADDPLTPPTTQVESGADIKGVGGGKTDEGMVSFDISAHQRGTDGPAFGHVSATFHMPTGSLSVYVRVDCVSVQSIVVGGVELRRASIGGAVERTNHPVFTLGRRAIVWIEDQGQPSDANATVGDDFVFSTLITDCRTTPYSGEINNVDSGNITIKLG